MASSLRRTAHLITERSQNVAEKETIRFVLGGENQSSAPKGIEVTNFSVGNEDDQNEDKNEEHHDEHKSQYGDSRPKATPTTTSPPTGIAVQASRQSQTLRPQSKDSLSSGAQHALIAVGSMVGTIVLMLAIYTVYVTRKRRLRRQQQQLEFAPKHLSVSMSSESPLIQPESPLIPYGKYTPSEYNESVKMGIAKEIIIKAPSPVVKKDVSRPAYHAMTGGEVYTSPRSPGLSDIRSESKDLANANNNTSPNQSSENSRKHENTGVASSNIFPNQNLRDTLSTVDTREGFLQQVKEEEERKNKGYLSSSTSPPTTFMQFLANRHMSQYKVSRFSWTNSQSAQTPAVPSFDTLPIQYRESGGIDKRRSSSVARFRTVDSWVENQASRNNKRRRRDSYRQSRYSNITSRTSTRLSLFPKPPPRSHPRIP